MDVNNIVVGLQADNTLKVGNYGDLEAAAVDVGLIKGGIKISHDETQYDVKVDQFIGTVKKAITDESMKITLALAEVSLANLAVAFGYPTTAVAANVFSFGAKTSVTERTLYINPKGPGSGNAKITLWRCIPTGKTSPAYTKEKETLVDVEFDVIVDTTKTAEQRFGTQSQVASDSTPPTIALSAPADGGTVAKTTLGTVTLLITEANGMDENSIVYGDTVSIINTTVPATAALVAGTIVYSASAKTVVFTPTAVWVASDTFQLIVSKGLKDAAGNHLAAPYIAQFSVTA